MEVQYRVLDLRLSLRTIFDFYYYTCFIHSIAFGMVK